MNSRRKPISDEDEELFRLALKDARPLVKRARVSPQVKPAFFVSLPRYPAEPAYNERPAPSIGGHADAHLRRGRIDPEARLDLHGMTQDGAYRALVRFLVRAQSEGLRLVLVITGKGGVLRQSLPLWLGQAELKPLVGGMNEAHAKHGGSGAYYVAVRKHARSR